MGVHRIKCIAIMGATSTGKSHAAIELAEEFGGEVVSMDSRQVYRGMDIGTGKVTPAEYERVPHHLIDILDPRESWSAGRHAALAESAIATTIGRGRLPLLVGGTGLYFRAFYDGLIDVVIPREELNEIRMGFADRPTESLYRELSLKDRTRAEQVSSSDRVRITRALELMAYTGTPVTDLYARRNPREQRFDVLKFILTMPRHLLRGKIAARTSAMFNEGWVGEVRALLADGVPVDAPGMQGLGYAEIAAAVGGGEDPRACREQIITRTQQYAKRQETFFRREADAHWVDVTEDGHQEDTRGAIRQFLEGAST